MGTAVKMVAVGFRRVYIDQDILHRTEYLPAGIQKAWQVLFFMRKKIRSETFSYFTGKIKDRRFIN